MNEVHLFFNPESGSFSADRVDAVQSLLREAGIEFTAYFPSSGDETIEKVRSISQATTEPKIVAVGGDGTVNTVLNGIVNPGAMLCYIPLGTANVLARELGIRSQGDAVSRIRSGVARPFTVGRLSGTEGSKNFLLMAGIGFDGAVVAAVRPREKKFLGKGAFVLAGLRTLSDWDPGQLVLEDDGERLPCHTLVACNAAHYGGNYRIAPGASLFTPTLEVIGVAGCRRIQFTLGVIAAIVAGNVPARKGVWRRSVTQIRITGTKAVQVDGDAAGFSPVTISAIPSFARIIV